MRDTDNDVIILQKNSPFYQYLEKYQPAQLPRQEYVQDVPSGEKDQEIQENDEEKKEDLKRIPVWIITSFLPFWILHKELLNFMKEQESQAFKWMKFFINTRTLPEMDDFKKFSNLHKTEASKRLNHVFAACFAHALTSLFLFDFVIAFLLEKLMNLSFFGLAFIIIKFLSSFAFIWHERSMINVHHKQMMQKLHEISEILKLFQHNFTPKFEKTLNLAKDIELVSRGYFLSMKTIPLDRIDARENISFASSFLKENLFQCLQKLDIALFSCTRRKKEQIYERKQLKNKIDFGFLKDYFSECEIRLFSLLLQPSCFKGSTKLITFVSVLQNLVKILEKTTQNCLMIKDFQKSENSSKFVTLSKEIDIEMKEFHARTQNLFKTVSGYSKISRNYEKSETSENNGEILQLSQNFDQELSEIFKTLKESSTRIQEKLNFCEKFSKKLLFLQNPSSSSSEDEENKQKFLEFDKTTSFAVKSADSEDPKDDAAVFSLLGFDERPEDHFGTSKNINALKEFGIEVLYSTNEEQKDKKPLQTPKKRFGLPPPPNNNNKFSSIQPDAISSLEKTETFSLKIPEIPFQKPTKAPNLLLNELDSVLAARKKETEKREIMKKFNL